MYVYLYAWNRSGFFVRIKLFTCCCRMAYMIFFPRYIIFLKQTEIHYGAKPYTYTDDLPQILLSFYQNQYAVTYSCRQMSSGTTLAWISLQASHRLPNEGSRPHFQTHRGGGLDLFLGRPRPQRLSVKTAGRWHVLTGENRPVNLQSRPTNHAQKPLWLNMAFRDNTDCKDAMRGNFSGKKFHSQGFSVVISTFPLNSMLDLYRCSSQLLLSH